MENTNKTNTTVKVLSAFAIGAAIGSVLGILFAPDKGSETRKKIAAKGGDISDAVKKKYSDLLSDVNHEVSSLKTRANDAMENGAAKLEKYIK